MSGQGVNKIWHNCTFFSLKGPFFRPTKNVEKSDSNFLKNYPYVQYIGKQCYCENNMYRVDLYSRYHLISQKSEAGIV